MAGGLKTRPYTYNTVLPSATKRPSGTRRGGFQTRPHPRPQTDRWKATASA